MPSNKVTVRVRLNVVPKEEPKIEKTYNINIKQTLAEGFIIYLVLGLIANILKGVGYPFFTDNWILVWIIVIALVIARISLRSKNA